MLKPWIYIIHRLRFATYSQAVEYAASCGWVVVSGKLETGNEIRLQVMPAVIGELSTKKTQYEKEKAS